MEEFGIDKRRMTTTSLPNRVAHLTSEIQALYARDAIPWVVGFSGGKDSTAVLQLVWTALLGLPADQRHKEVHVITTDTGVESPIVAGYVRQTVRRMSAAAESQGIRVKFHLLEPELKDSYWVNLIGRGYPAPRPMFRWCTERLKIRPSNRFIREVVRASGEALLVLGSRKAESSRRAAALNHHEAKRVEERLSPNSKLPNSIVYTPIEDWTSDEVWLYLMAAAQTPWGISNRDLMSLYRVASEDNECPLVVDTTTPSCGNSRFGCWVCTLVERDRSMEAMIDNDPAYEWMLPMLELRNELASFDKEKAEGWRDQRRAAGHVQLFNDEPIPGPYLRERREHWLRRILEVQQQVRADGPESVREIELIRLSELREIRRIWRQEKHEFDDSLPRLYREVTGRAFPREIESTATLDGGIWAALEEVCEGDAELFLLATHLLGAEARFRTMARRVGVLDEIEKVLERRGHLSQQQAIDEARAEASLRRNPTLEQVRSPIDAK